MPTCEAVKAQYKKRGIPKAIREQLWLSSMGKVFDGKCKTRWCKNTITIFDFQCGHNVPESKGGLATLDNLVPICSRCNTSMGNSFTFIEWSAMCPVVIRPWSRFFSCFHS